MTTGDIIRYRLYNQQIAESKFKRPADIVGWMVAMQAQEYAMAKWAIGLRLPGATDEMIENAFNKGEILRTHLMRPTWHFVTPKDIRWLLQLTAPRVKALNAFINRQQGLDNKIFKRSNEIIAKELEGGKQFMRAELQLALARKKIAADGVRLICLLMQAELDGIICSGARKGNQHTYTLLDHRAPLTKAITNDEALARFAERYFSSRGPATVKDFSTWSGLSLTESRHASRMLSSKFSREIINGHEYIFIPRDFDPGKKIQTSFLMPDYDEYGMGYKDRTAIRDAPGDFKYFTGENPAFNRMIIIDGKIAGTWKRIIKNKKVSIETVPFRALTKSKQQVLAKMIKQYCGFVGKEIE